MANTLALDQKYRMLSDHEIPILGYGVSSFLFYILRLLRPST